MGEFGSALLNVVLLILALGGLTAVFGLPGFIVGFAVDALGSTIGNVGAIGALTAVLGGILFLLVIGMTITSGAGPIVRRRERPEEPRWRRWRNR